MDSRDTNVQKLHRSSSSRDTNQLPQLHLQNVEAEDPTHPVHQFSFPAVNPDGSILNLTAHQSRPYPPTPPAALSSLGIRAKMAGKKDTASESDGSFADSQYDMIDDLSDTSNDDHDTASIASQDGPSGQCTPEYAQSEADDVQEQAEQPELEHTETIIVSPSAESVVTLPSVTLAFPDSIAQSTYQTKVENDLIDSYTSEDLETPRQSTMTSAFASTYRLSQRKTSSQAVQDVEDDPFINHILFMSDRDMSPADIEIICCRAASSMDHADTTGKFKYEFVRLPATPSGMQAPAKIMRVGDGVSATFQHCIGAETREGDSYKLLIVDPDEEGSSFYTIGKDAKIDLPTPKLAIFHLDQSTKSMAWFDTAYKAMQSVNVPTLVIQDKDFAAAETATISYGEGKSQLILDATNYMGMERSELKQTIARLTGEDPASVSPSSGFDRPQAKIKERWARDNMSILFVLTLVMSILSFATLSAQYHFTMNPAVDLAIRREALEFALHDLASSVNITQAFDVKHLMPAPFTNCTRSAILASLPGFLPCPMEAHYQTVAPNHAIMSLQNGPREPRVVSVGASRNDDRMLSVRQTKLMPGVYHLALDPSEAYGNVNFTVKTKSPEQVISWSDNFGSRLLQRKTYQKVSTDISKAVSKDVAVMRHAAMGITEKVSTEIGVGLWVTKNVTSQLALYVTRDIQLAANTAVSVFTNAAKASNKTACSLGKDLVLVQKGISAFRENVSKSFKSKMIAVRETSNALIRAPVDMSKQRLALSRERMQRLKKALSRPSKKEIVVPKESSLLSKFETYLAATPEHELESKQKGGCIKVSRRSRLAVGGSV